MFWVGLKWSGEGFPANLFRKLAENEKWAASVAVLTTLFACIGGLKNEQLVVFVSLGGGRERGAYSAQYLGMTHLVLSLCRTGVIFKLLHGRTSDYKGLFSYLDAEEMAQIGRPGGGKGQAVFIMMSKAPLKWMQQNDHQDGEKVFCFLIPFILQDTRKKDKSQCALF